MRFIAAIGMGALMPNLISMMTEYSPLKSRAMVVAAMYCGYSRRSYGFLNRNVYHSYYRRLAWCRITLELFH